MSRLPLLGAAIIVKNEAEHLERNLRSLRGVCDEVVVVDTGSTDSTVDVARSHGARLLFRTWDGDFSAARNTALDAVTAQWVLYIDADEEVQPVDVGALHRQLRNAAGIVGFTVRFSSHVGWTPYWEYRMWRNRPDIRFRNRIHETHVPDLRRITRDEGSRIERSILALQHYGYEGNQTPKHHRNLPLLQQQVIDSPRRVYLWNHLGRVHDGLRDSAAAESAWQRGIDIVRADGLKEPVDILVYGSMALHLIRNRRDASAVIAEGLALDPDHYTLVLAAARQLAVSGDFVAAAARLQALIEAGSSDIDHPVLSYNSAMFGLWPQQLLGECLFELGQYAQAADAFQAALELGGPSLEVTTKIALCRSLAGRRSNGTGASTSDDEILDHE